MASDPTNRARRDDGDEAPTLLPSALRRQFHQEAHRRYADLLVTGMAIDWPSMRRYLERRMAGLPAERPVPRKLLR